MQVPGVGREARQFPGLGLPQGDRIGSPLQKTQIGSMVRRGALAPVPRAAGGRMILWPPLSGCPGVGREIRQLPGLGPPQGDRIGSPLQKTQIGSMVHRRTPAPVPRAAGGRMILWPPLSGCLGLEGRVGRFPDWGLPRATA